MSNDTDKQLQERLKTGKVLSAVEIPEIVQDLLWLSAEDGTTGLSPCRGDAGRVKNPALPKNRTSARVYESPHVSKAGGSKERGR
jgi:hypothetical protein